MRDFRDAKVMAQTLRAALAAKGHKVTIGESLELIAKLFGAVDWNTLSAAIKAADTDKAAAPAAAPAPSGQALETLAVHLGWPSWQALTAALQTVGSRSRPGAGQASPEPRAPTNAPQKFSVDLEATLHRSVALAAEREHEYTTVEHLLLALTDDADATLVMRACDVDVAALRTKLLPYVDDQLVTLVRPGVTEPSPTAGFHRVVQRAVLHVQSANRYPVTGANILVAIFSEEESHACHYLLQRGMTRWDAVNFIANGIRKGDVAG